MPENYVIIEGLRCPVCGVLNVRELATWRMGNQTVRQLECMNGHRFRDYERNGVHHPIVYRHNTLGETTGTQTESTVTAIENGRWQFAPAPTITLTDFDRVCKFLKAGTELELDYPEFSQHAEIDNKTIDFFGMYIMRYHAVPQCPVCGRTDCWVHIPPKGVRAIQRDASVDIEFLFYGSSESSEDYATQIKPTIDFLSQHYKVTERDSAHVHLLLTDDYKPLPVTVAYNYWQLVRYFYPGYAWIFGNTPGSFLRRNSYSGFQDLLSSPLFDHVGGTRNAVYFGESYINRGKIIIFNIENRLADASLNVKQLVALRAVNLALMKRAAELSLIGLIKVDNEKWPFYKGLGQIINDLIWRNLSPQQVDMNLIKQWMKMNAEEMLDEIAHFLTPFEYSIVKELIENPPREQQNVTNTEINIPEKRINRTLIQAVINAPVTKSENESIKIIAKTLGKSEAKVKEELEKLGAKWTNGRFKVVA